MTDPLRLRVHKRLTTLLEAVVWDDHKGNTQSLQGKVFRGRSVFGDESDPPFMSILEAPIPDEVETAPIGGSTTKNDWQLVIQGFVPDDRMNPTDPAHLMMAPVKKALIEERMKAHNDRPEDAIFGLGRSVEDMYVGAGVVRPPDAISANAYFWLTLTLKMIEDLADPYGQ